ncbi:beta-N-acetylhexosaminidase [Ginsengibacter hankyongi]|uniref:beta-N-acetylhexosaminidase n=1 Tax=Ginsengibacter hankyongi TaxID=2607284 RepID=A0A5J5IHD5_9BACT|nr:beta-N-acetylhexosaminidase [Ginsengibacter hankyongi]KAA9038666.1 beta-N-acetylhexosaminidase [Ginsengibacter hankyongi]
MNRKVRLYVLVMMFPFCTFAQKNADSIISSYNIIPKPVSVSVLTGKNILVNKSTIIYSGEHFADQAAYLKKQIQDQCGLELPVQLSPTAKGKSSSIVLKYDTISINKPEMYLLSIRNNRLVIKAKDVPGVVHGIETLLQLLPLHVIKNVSISPLAIVDYPRFVYRGMHLDVSRHFFPVDYIKRYIDYLTFYKFNTFHWHLTDDQGWRIQINSYPKLTQVGAWRDSTLVGHFRDKPTRFDGIRYGGFYTHEDIRKVIKYAAIRGITVIPEIDIPGHSRAIIASYPEFSTNPDTTFDVATSPGMYNWKNNVLAPNEKTFAFLKAVFNEITDLFPSPYIHIGGDECSHKWWKADPKTQDFMKEHGIGNETALQTYFMQQVIEDLKLKGKKVIGWDEILEGGLDTSAIIMNWRGVKAAIQAAKEKHHVIMSPSGYTYFNFSQTKNEDSLTQGGYLPLNKVYDFDPIPEVLDSLEEKYILGAQGNVWTEYIANKAKLEYMIFPRMTAFSEALWTAADKKDFNDFKRRLKDNAIPRYQFWKSNYFKNYESPESGKK